jgi:drug/metabolite transporter (DMT)-like permease
MNYSTGIIAAFITLACWTIGTFSFTKAAKLISPVSLNRVRLLYACVLLTFLTCITAQISPLQLFLIPTIEQWFWLGISGIIGLSIGDFFAFSAYKILGSSRTSLFSIFAPGAALILGFFMLGEQMNIVGMMGMLISVSGLIWFIKSNAKKKDEAVVDTKHIAQGILFAALGAITQGMGLVLSKKGLFVDTNSILSPLHATWIRLFVATVTIYIFGFIKTNLWTEWKYISSSKQVMKPLLIGTLFGPVLGVSMSLYAATHIEVSIAQTIFSLLPISVITAAFLLGKEKLEASSIIAAAIGVAGVFVLVWRNDLLRLF